MQQTPAKQLYDLLVSKNFDPETLDSSGKPASDPSEAEIISFDFISSSGTNYGSVVIMLGDDKSLDVYTGDNVGRTMESVSDKDEWFDFLQQLKPFAVKNQLTFSTKNINRLKYSMQGQAAIKEGLFESWHGNKNTSYNDKPEHVRLMIKHKRPLGETDARYRYIESLFVETSDGERFKLPFTKLSGGRAMCEHVRNGGKPYDARGQHIASVVEELNVLSRFRRANHGRVFEGDTAELISETNAYYETLHKVLKGLGTQRGYANYFECWNPAAITEQELVVESIKNMFVRQSLDERIEEALPILARIQQQGRAMKEANIFESWANRLMEGTWSIPDTPEQKEKLVALMSQEFPVGADATNATEQLYDLLGDDQLFDQLQNLADQNANADARQLVLARMQELADDPNVAEVISQLNADIDAPAEPELDAEVSADETGLEQEIEEAMSDENKAFWSNRSQLWAKLGNVIKSVQTPEQFKAAQKYATLMRTRLAKGLDDGIGGDTQYIQDYKVITNALAKKAQELGLDVKDEFKVKEESSFDETIDPANPKDYEIPTYLRQQQGQTPLTLQDIQDKEGKAKAEYQARLGVKESDDGLSRIKSLAGILAK